MDKVHSLRHIAAELFIYNEGGNLQNEFTGRKIRKKYGKTYD